MVRKFFPLDKNYLLEAVQLQQKTRLLTELIEKAKIIYQEINNPLGLNDNFSEQIRLYRPDDLTNLDSFYQNLAAIYRFKYGETQLGFLWDGKDHSEKYNEDWSSAFTKWTDKLCLQIQFVQAVLDLSVFLPSKGHTHLPENRMNAVTLNLFEMRIHKTKGIVETRVA